MMTRREAATLLASTLAPAWAGAAPALPPRTLALDLAQPGAPLDRWFDHCVGADYPGTLQRDNCLAQLKTTVAETGFRHLRFHAIFHDVLGTVKRDGERLVFDFSAITRLYDALLARGIKPYVELGFTPEALATSAQKIFYWQGNTSHPDPAGWRALIDAFTRHLIARYGAEEVRQWHFEVWNEPNLDGFWEKADQAAYFSLYVDTARTLKAIDPGLRVGGPATAGADWVVPFLAHAHAQGAPVDFITTHTYGVEEGFLDEFGQSDRKLSNSPDAIVGDVRRVREQIQASRFPGLPLHITEWSTSYNPRDLVHDHYISASYVLAKLRAVRGLAQSMSYWTFSDLFEEAGPPPTPFHGGFGLMNREGLRKPAYFAYKYLHALQGRELVLPAGTDALAATEGRRTTVLAWDWAEPHQDVSNRGYYGRVRPTVPARPLQLRLRGMAPGRYRVTVQRTGFQANDATSAYQQAGSPEKLDDALLQRLHDLTADRPERAQRATVARHGQFQLTLPMRRHDVVLVTIEG